MARGLPEPTVKAVWSRESIPDPPKVPLSGPPPSFTALNLVTSVIEISHDNMINRIKNKFTAETANKCSSFDVVSAMIFKSRAKAIKLADTAEVVFVFVTSTRHLLHGILPSVEGYYGNCLYTCWISKTTGEINNASLVDVITLIKDAKDARSTKFVDWMNSGSNTFYNLPMDYSMVIVSDWRWVGFNEVDYGWGKPKYVFPLENDENIVRGGVIYFQTPMPTQGFRLIFRCVEKEHLTEFCDNLLKF
ncbi:acyl transferase 5-like [Carex rostrata]